MAKIVTPASFVQLVVERRAPNGRLAIQQTRFQKTLFWIATTSVLVSVVTGAASYWFRFPWIAATAILFIFLATVFGAAYQVAVALPELLRLRYAEADFSAPLVKEFDEDIDLIATLARDFEAQHLLYAESRFRLAGEQLRGRISLLVGALDKVGVIPLAVTAYLSGAKAIKDGLVAFGGVQWLLVGLVLLYLFAIRMSSVAQWLDRCALLYNSALSLRQRREG